MRAEWIFNDFPCGLNVYSYHLIRAFVRSLSLAPRQFYSVVLTRLLSLYWVFVWNTRGWWFYEVLSVRVVWERRDKEWLIAQLVIRMNGRLLPKSQGPVLSLNVTPINRNFRLRRLNKSISRWNVSSTFCLYSKMKELVSENYYIELFS